MNPGFLVIGFFVIAIPLGAAILHLLEKFFPVRGEYRYCGSVWCERGCEGNCWVSK